MPTTERSYTGPKHPKPRHPVSAIKAFRWRILTILAVLGPGFITANVDNDPGGILTYSQAGAKYGYTLLWTLIPTTIALIVVQEMAARMGAITGKGLSDLIREEFGLRMTFSPCWFSGWQILEISRPNLPGWHPAWGSWEFLSI